MACAPTKTRLVLLILLFWLFAAIAVVGSGLLARVPPPLLVLVLAIIVITTSLKARGLRQWVQKADLRLFLFPHLIRFVGIAFLVMINKGVLVPAFTPIAWGDLVAAVGAVALLVLGAPVRNRSLRWVWLSWNSFGLADMVLLLVTGIRLGSAAPEQFTLFRQLPLGLLPTFAVPLIIATHVFIYLKLFRFAEQSPADHKSGDRSNNADA